MYRFSAPGTYRTARGFGREDAGVFDCGLRRRRVVVGVGEHRVTRDFDLELVMRMFLYPHWPRQLFEMTDVPMAIMGDIVKSFRAGESMESLDEMYSLSTGTTEKIVRAALLMSRDELEEWFKASDDRAINRGIRE